MTASENPPRPVMVNGKDISYASLFISQPVILEYVDIIKKYKSFIYISDLVSPQKELSSFLRENGAEQILHFNEINSGFEPDILFVTDSFNYEFFDNRFEVYRGFEYYIVGNEVIKNRKKKLENIESIKNILICFGGADPAFFTEYFVEKIITSF